MSGLNQIQFQALTIIASSSVTTSYVSAVTLNNPAVMFAVKNGTNGDVLISFDGSTNHLGFPASSGSAYDIRTNAPTTSNFMLPKNTNISVKWNGSAPSSPTGNVYIELMETI